MSAGALLSLTPGGDASSLQAGDASHMATGDASFAAAGDGKRRCGFCVAELLQTTARPDAKFCGRKCRQSAFRLRRRRATDSTERGSLRFAYADPPYPGRAWKYYRHPEVNHPELVEQLLAGGFDGWALSTSADALRSVLPLCPEGARVCSWVKPHGASPRTFGLHNCWEPLIVVSGRRLRGGVRDWLRAMPARGGGTLPGRKPLAFCGWLFDCLGMLPGDQLTDLFPGSGIVGRAWDSLSLRTSATDAASFTPAGGAA